MLDSYSNILKAGWKANCNIFMLYEGETPIRSAVDDSKHTELKATTSVYFQDFLR